MTLFHYADESTGGNVLGAHLRRKAMCSYITILEMDLLWIDAWWLPFSLLRSEDLDQIEGGYAAVLRKLLEIVHSETVDGFPMQFGEDEPELVFFAKCKLIGDHEQVRRSTGAKGAAGIKPCVKCANVLMLGRKAEGHVDIECSRSSELQPMTQALVDKIAVYMAPLRGKQLEDAEKHLGYLRASLQSSYLRAPGLRAWCEHGDIVFDAMHCYHSNGVTAQELGLWFQKLLETTDLSLATMRDFFKDGWSTADGSQSAAGISRLFHTKLWRHGSDFRGDAAECISVLPLVVHYGEEKCRRQYPDMAPALDSLMALYRVVHRLQQLKVSSRTEIEMMPKPLVLHLQERHVSLFVEAYPGCARPKLHYGLHLEQQIQDMSKFVDCFVGERKHKEYKLQVSGVPVHFAFNKSLLQQLTQKNLATVYSLQTAKLKAPVAITIHNRPAQEASSMDLPLTGHISKGHVKILHEDCAILVDSCVLLDGHFFLKASCLEKMDTQTFGLRTLWRQKPRHGEQITLVPVDALNHVHECSWKQQYTKGNHKFFCILR